MGTRGSGLCRARETDKVLLRKPVQAHQADCVASRVLEDARSRRAIRADTWKSQFTFGKIIWCHLHVSPNVRHASGIGSVSGPLNHHTGCRVSAVYQGRCQHFLSHVSLGERLRRRLETKSHFTHHALENESHPRPHAASKWFFTSQTNHWPSARWSTAL